ncbi:bifunctional DNA primase/polymerase [Actinacidiphila acidipaludis]|uniref:DNA primase/polymerase bifunctional N-terminal domain-containing protein n=1 Tax=Actinacidiphila acidipaludis TaxID=2873382 RepID=A0ABS7Q951_9ACTN|nr:bifunctional DNA primase/polymerase [Streptomyces acidipaludis]MBY8879229.1 hypothetical protein [Streptomyces acidipaludis]
MDEWHALDVVSEALRRQHTAYVTPEGAAWLASASAFPRSVEALWSARPTAPSVLPCGTAFDVVNAPALFGRRLLEQLWGSGPGSGPAALHRGRVLLLVAPGTAQRLPSLLGWEEWADRIPPLLCHGAGEAVTVPPLYGPPGGAQGRCSGYDRHSEDRGSPDGGSGDSGDAADALGTASRWVVAPDTRSPWLPGPDVLLWACVRAARGGAPGPGRVAPSLVSTPEPV